MQHHAEPTVVDFASAAQAALLDLRERVGMDGWLVARRDGSDYVVLAAVDDVFGVQTGAVSRWEDTYCARMTDGTAPMSAPVVDVVPAYARARELNGIDAKSYLAVPMLSPDGEQLGTVCAAGKEIGSDEMANVLPTVQLQAAMLGALLSHELRIADEQRHAGRVPGEDQLDALTGLGNQVAWDAALTAEELRAGRHASSTSVVILGVDELRLANSSAGHGAGDELLQQAATILRPALRSADFVARLGGTFGLLLPLTTAEGAAAVTDHLVDILAAAQIEVSVGVACRHSDRGLIHAWREADAAMSADRVRRAASRAAVDSAIAAPARVAAAEALLRPRRTPELVDEAVADPVDEAALARTATRGTGSVDALLRLARDQLGMDVAFLSVFEGDNRRIRSGQALVDFPIPIGFVQPSSETQCRLIADGLAPEVTPDAAAQPLFAALPMTAALGIRAYVGVPVHRRNGELYGTLCTFSLKPDASLSDRSAQVLHSLSEIVMDLVEVEDRHEGVRHELMARLDGVYAASGPSIVYQPVVTLEGLRTVGFEALSRFPGSTANPAEWFAAATAAGFGAELELQAVRNALTGLPLVQGFLSVNVSPATVRTPAFSRLMDPLPLDRIVLELTEHEQIHDYAGVTRTLKPFRDRGLRIAVDDAGAGFASMAHILALVPDLIKLDISLVRAIDVDRGRQALAAALTAFAVKTGAGVIAEGVETVDELECLRGLHIDYGQGYHLGRPGHLPAAA